MLRNSENCSLALAAALGDDRAADTLTRCLDAVKYHPPADER